MHRHRAGRALAGPGVSARRRALAACLVTRDGDRGSLVVMDWKRRTRRLPRSRVPRHRTAADAGGSSARPLRGDRVRRVGRVRGRRTRPGPSLVHDGGCRARRERRRRGARGLSSGDGVVVRFSDKPIAVPAFALTDLDGKPVRPSDWRGKVVLVNFWATWCGPCREEIPALMALQDRYADQLLVVGLSIDEGDRGRRPRLRAPASDQLPRRDRRRQIQQPFGGIPAVPSTFVVGPDTMIVSRHVGVLDPILTGAGGPRARDCRPRRRWSM